MPVTVKNPVIKNRLRKLKKPPIKQALNAVKGDLVDEAKYYDWNDLSQGIETVQDTDTSGKVFMNKSKYKEGNATYNQVGGWLHFGRGEIRPVKAKVLRWFENGEAVFARYAKATKPIYWWGLKETAVKKVREIYNNWIKSFGK